DVARGGKIMAKDVLFEIGLEELPARFVDNAEKQLKEKTKNWLKELRISFESVKSFSTPRRLAVLINQVSEIQESLDIEAKGPAEKIAKDEKGNWTKAAIGFTKGQGKTTDDIYIKEIKGIPYIHVNKHIEGKRSEDLLSSFKEVIESLHFESNMKWGEYSMHFARPIRWLVALYDTKIIPFELTNVKSTDDIYIKEIKGIPYIHVNKHIEGKRSEDLLSSFKEVIESLHFESNMKWGEYSMHFARPIRWLVALYDTKIIPFELTNVK